MGGWMITKWSFSSLMAILFSLILVFHFYWMNLICWILLESLTWSLFFLFFKDYGKTTINNLFLFLVLQTMCRYVWFIMRIFLKLIEFDIISASYYIIALVLMVKIGLFPGHSWALKVYSSSGMSTIFALSSSAKILPIALLLVWVGSAGTLGGNEVVSIWVIASYVIVLWNLSNVRSVLSFIFFSRLINFRNMVLIIAVNKVLFLICYYLSYIWGLITFILLYYHFSVKDLIGYRKPLFQVNIGFPHILSLAGYPPFTAFWIKITLIYELWIRNFFISISSTIIFLVIFLYLFTLLIFICKNWWNESQMENKPGEIRIKGLSTSSKILPHFFILIMPAPVLLLWI